MHQVQELSAKEKTLKRSQTSINARKSSLMAGKRDSSISTPNPNLSNQKQTVLNSNAHNLKPTSAPRTAQPWLMPEYMTLPQTPLFGTTYGRTIVGTLPTSAPQIQHQTTFGTSQFRTLAKLEASYLDSKTSATTCYEPEWPNLGLVNLEQRDNFETYSGLCTETIYCTEFGETFEQ